MFLIPPYSDIMASVSQTESENPLKRIIDFMPTVDDSYYDFHSKKALSAFVPGTRLVFRKQACTETGHKPACMTYTATIYDSTFVVWVYNTVAGVCGVKVTHRVTFHLPNKGG